MKALKRDVHTPGVILQAKQAAQWLADHGTIVPRLDLSEELKTECLCVVVDFSKNGFCACPRIV